MAGKDQSDTDFGDSPTRGVDHDEKALEDAERKMHVSTGDGEHDDDPEGGHDPAALKEAAKRMGAEP